MASVRRSFGFSHVAIAAAVPVQALASESYDAELSATVWLILNWLMAVAVITAVAFSYMRWRAGVPATGTWLSPRTLLITSAVLLLLYFEQWSSEFGTGTAALSSFRRTLWLFIDTLFVVVNVSVGLRLLRGR